MFPALPHPVTNIARVELITEELVEAYKCGSTWPRSCSCITHVEELSWKMSFFVSNGYLIVMS